MNADVVGTTLFEGIGSIENSDWTETDLSKCTSNYNYLYALYAPSVPLMCVISTQPPVYRFSQVIYDFIYMMSQTSESIFAPYRQPQERTA